MSGCILRSYTLHSPMFLVNSCLDLFTAPAFKQDPFSRSYRAILPSSLTMNLPSALVFSTQLRVSVYGTGGLNFITLSAFSRRSLPSLSSLPKEICTIWVRLEVRTLLHLSTPTPFNALFRKDAEVSLPRQRITCTSQQRNVDRFFHSASPLGLSLGPG